MTIRSHQEYIRTCETAIEALCELAEYTADGHRELSAGEIQWLALVQMSYFKMVGGGENGDDSNDSSDFRIDGDLY